MDNELYVNTALLREHGAVKQEEYYLAADLLERLYQLKAMIQPNVSFRLDETIKETNKVAEYLFLMRDVVDNMAVDFERFSHQGSMILTENLQ